MTDGATLGLLLRGARETRGLSVDDLSSATRIKPRHLHALEEERLGDLPAPVFVRGFIRAYCASVGAPPSEPLRLYEERVGAARAAAAAASPPPARAARDWRAGPVVPALLAVGLLLVGGALYLFSQSGPPGLPPDSSAQVPPR
jgi:cytoskeletal protein RodZ